MKYKKILLVMMLLLGTFFSNLMNTYAFNLTNPFSGFYYDRNDASEDAYYKGTLKNFSLDGKTAYCIEPGVEAGTDQYEASNWFVSNLAADIKRDVTLYAYYGYDYPGHQTTEYRAAAQALIWERILGNKTHVNFYLTEERKESDLINISKERAEILKLRKKHDAFPSFSGETHTAILNEEYELTDKNDVISNYQVTLNEGVGLRFDGDKLIVTPTKKGKFKISFERKHHYEAKYVIYHDDTYQDVIVAGEDDQMTFNLFINVEGAKITIEKVDKETNLNVARGEASLEGAVYALCTSNDKLVDTLTTDSEGKAVYPKLLKKGDYYIKEIKPSPGYLLDPEKHEFTVGDDDAYNLKVQEEIIEKNFKFYKVITSGKTGIQTPEANIEFGIYNLKGELISKHQTNSEGFFEVTLPYGNYYLRQLTVTEGIEALADYYFSVTEPGSETKIFADAAINAYLKVVKIDALTKKTIPLGNIKFKIYDVINKKYVALKVSYPSPQTIDVFETDSNGILLTPEALPSGTYYLEEVDEAIPGYLWNKEKIEFTIDKDTDFKNMEGYGKYIEIKFSNYPVKGQIEIVKTGNNFLFTEEGILEEKIFLPGVTFGLYAKEDIFDVWGKLIYRKDTLIGEYETDEDGKIIIANLELGKYYLKEHITLKDYLLDENIYDVAIEYQDQYTKVVTKKIEIENKMLQGKLKLLKIDEDTNETLANVLIAVYTLDGKKIFEARTNEMGIIELDLPLGSYYLIEEETLDGYILYPEKVYFDITEEALECLVTLKNQKEEIIIEVPDTYVFIPNTCSSLFMGGLYFELKKIKYLN